MEDVLDLYAEPCDPQRPVVCFDETSTQFLVETRVPARGKTGRPRREDYEYVRAGTRNLRGQQQISQQGKEGRECPNSSISWPW